MKKEDIHFLREQYNKNIVTNDNLQNILKDKSIEETINLPCSSLRKLKKYHQKYQNINKFPGRVCHICGLNDIERSFLYEKYIEINKKYRKHFKEIKKFAQKTNLSDIVELLHSHKK